ncbi:MAG: 50S ribosomal protein L32 [Treponema sp.]|nr:50S ribosomal protein L32 [Treponema sp.]
MAVPRYKTSKARTSRRQSINMKLSGPTLVECPSCGNMVLLHRACPRCGFYRGKQVIAPESKAT